MVIRLGGQSWKVFPEDQAVDHWKGEINTLSHDSQGAKPSTWLAWKPSVARRTKQSHLLASTSLLSGKKCPLALQLLCLKITASSISSSRTMILFWSAFHLENGRNQAALRTAFDVMEATKMDFCVCAPTNKLSRALKHWEWKCFKLSRVACLFLAVDVQAGVAADNIKFIVRFWNELMTPGLHLKANLAIAAAGSCHRRKSVAYPPPWCLQPRV